MKTPTTEWDIATQEKIQINREFLLSQGWKLNEEYPLYETFEHSKDKDLVCFISLEGGFGISELHWCNKTHDRSFITINSNLTKEDYFKIIELLNIKIPK